MGRKNRRRGRPQAAKRVRVVGVVRPEIDKRLLGKALLGLAQAEAERQAQAEHRERQAEAEKDGGADDGK